MLDRDAIIARLRAQEGALRQSGVGSLYLFGSTARGEHGDGSDVDLFMDQSDPMRFSLIDLLTVQYDLSDVLDGRKVDLMTRKGIHPLLRERIEASAIQVF